ncbi:MAG: hypothetical protein PHC75_04025 [Burkholderiales bacterium]|nr:hypothetical protein [Burkholderiales bacterium]
MKRYLLFFFGFFLANITFADNYESIEFTKKIDNLKIIKVDDIDYLYIDGSRITTPSDFYVLSIAGKAIIDDTTSYIIWGGSGGTIDSDSNLHYIFVNVDQNKKVTVSKIFPEAYDNSINIINGLIAVKYPNDKPYSDKDDFGYYKYNPNANKMIITNSVKSDAYYEKTFAKYSAKQIVEKMKAEECYLVGNDGLLNFPHSCNYGNGYCYMFKSMKDPIKDQDYDLLKKSCADPYY